MPKDTYTVWCRLVAEPPTRWHPMPHFHNITEAAARKEALKGAERAAKHSPYLRYAVCKLGESPNDVELEKV